ncbi:MAG: thiamine pyrophosphate-dependent dehydrogenase E1 component subunit alpha [Rhodospirillaceae bacterium]|nr:thiamine pyrophosphate-dependent dehydrogenase E1 component subunit alpha [Rhodospirillaceae bacterium]
MAGESPGSLSGAVPSALLGRMLLIRSFDERLLDLKKQGHVPGHTSPYVGQEAIAVGVAAELEQGDVVASHHRPTGHALAAGLEPGRLLAELLGRSGGYCRGKAGKHQVSALEHGFLGANGVVGGGIPIAVGAALGLSLAGGNRVAVAYFGDGATNTGAFHEALNLAAVWSLPVLFVCENNGYAFSTRQEDHQRIKDIAERGAAYGMPGEVVDGNDIEAVRGAARRAVERARAGHGPTLLDAKTYRWHGQYDIDDSLSYRSQAEIDSWKQRCPIEAFRRRLAMNGANFAALQAEVEAALDRARDWALASPPAPIAEAALHVYAAAGGA